MDSQNSTNSYLYATLYEKETFTWENINVIK